MQQHILTIARVIFLCLVTSCASANSLIDAVSISAGFGSPRQLHGGRLAVQHAWRVKWLPVAGWHTTGFWDLSYAYWRTKGDHAGHYKSLSTLGLAPIIRIERDTAFANTINPYIEGGIGLALLSKVCLAQRRLGAHWAFQDMIGLGLRFGPRQQYDVSYHYLHYSNAGFSSYNSGIDVKSLVSFTYHFS